MRSVIFAGFVIAVALSTVAAFAQGTTTMYFIGPFEGEVMVKDYRTPGPPGWYYYPVEGRYPSQARCYEHPVRCSVCGHWRELGHECPVCGAQPDPQERAQARRGAVYSPYPIPGQYWYRRPMRSVTGPKHGMGWPYLSPRYQTGAH